MSHANADDPVTFRKYAYAGALGAYHYALMDRDPFYAAKIRKALALASRGCVVLFG
jgi:hypothetical protein